MSHQPILKRLFPSLTEANINRLLEIGKVVDYGERAVLCRQGEWADRFYILLSGTVGVYAEFEDELLQIDKIRDGCFGEIGLLLKQKRAASIYAKEPTQVIEITAHEFQQLATEVPEFALDVSKIIIKRMIEQDKTKLVRLRPTALVRDSDRTIHDLKAELRRITVEPVFGPPSLDARFQSDVLMIMPYGVDSLDRIYQDHIRKVATALELTITRADDFFSQEAIISEIWAATNQTRLVIADCSHRNPNVFYEMGVAHTIGKPVIAITQDEDDVPFDIRHWRYIHYEDTPEALERFEAAIQNAIKQILGMK